MKIKTKLYLSILVSATLIGLFLLTGIILFNSIGQESKRVKLAAEVKTAVFELNILLNDYLFNRTERAAQQWELRYNSGLALLQKAEAEESERELISSLANDYLLFSRSFTQVVENYNYKQKLIKDRASPQELALLENQDVRTISQLSIQSQSIISLANTLEKKALARLDETYALTRNSAYGLTILLLIITTAVSMKISRDIAKSLTKLHKGTEIIGAGNLEYTIDIKSKDEIGQVALAFNEMGAKLKESYTGLEEKVQARTKELEEKTASDEAMLVSIGDGVIAVDEKGNVIMINKSAQNMLGVNISDIIGKSWFESVSMEDEKGHLIPREKRPLIMALSHSKTIIITTTTGPTYYYVRKDKTKFPAAVVTTPVKIGSKMIGAIEVFRDITKEREIDQAKSEFVSLASHQLRTPLTTINWYSEMLLSGDAGKITEKQKEYLKELYLSSQRMNGLVSALLNVSRIEMGTLMVESVPTDVIGIADSVLDELKVTINEKNLKVSESHDQLPKIPVDPKIIRIVYQNILDNAVRYTPGGGRITLKHTLVKKGVTLNENPISQDCVLITVADTGYGIPKNQQAHVFEKLFRADNAREKDSQGTGLGLYIVKAIIDYSGGEIWFKSPTFVEKTSADTKVLADKSADTKVLADKSADTKVLADKSAGKEENKGTTFFVTLPLVGMPRKEGSKMLEG